MNLLPKNIRLYNQALEIIQLSRSIAAYMAYDLNQLDASGREQLSIYHTGDIIRQSDALAPHIIAAENQIFQDERIEHAHSLQQITHKLLKTCERLEDTESNARDFLKLLRKELRIFKRLQKTWVLSL